MLEQINTTIENELMRFPRGSRGSAQNIFRAIYQMTRASSLGRKDLWSGSASECEEAAVGIVRRTHPGFVPRRVSHGVTCGYVSGSKSPS
jgi:hypothetical protein